jgi:hypothetical protein
MHATALKTFRHFVCIVVVAVPFVCSVPAHAEQVSTSCGTAQITAVRVLTRRKSDRPLAVVDPIISSVAPTDGHSVTVTVLSPELRIQDTFDMTEIT